MKQSLNNNSLDRIRHSLAHIMAQAVMELRPGTKLGFGPPIDDGFYYDFILSAPLSESDFPEIERRMREFIRAGHEFKREESPKAVTLRRYGMEKQSTMPFAEFRAWIQEQIRERKR